MCGIVGVVGASDQRLVENALLTIQNRGPDGRRVTVLDGAILGHTRLAIIDLNDAASQPFESACGRYVIAFNGEIYNFSELRTELAGDIPWRTHSDTEVLLYAHIRWGKDALTKLRGMFAYAVWDKRDKSLFVARDRLGVKPLYFHNDGHTFGFASRPRALFELLPQLSREIDLQALRYYLESGYIPAPHSIHKSIRKLKPGHYLVVRDGNASTHCYWSMHDIPTDESLAKASEQDLLDELDSIVERAVRYRMIADVPLGAFLSGGIDSSLVTAYMCKNSAQPISTFTIGFDDPKFDESHHAAAVAKYLGTTHHQQILQASDLLDLLPTFQREYDEPFFDYSAFPTMAVARFARSKVKVALSSDGGDEIFGGYHYYRIAQQIDRLYSMPLALRSVAAGIAGIVPTRQFGLLASTLSKRDSSAAFAFMRGVSKDNQTIFSADLKAATKPLSDLFRERASSFAEGLSAAERAMRLDTLFTLPDGYLQKVDVASMAFSLEAREPLLDHEVLEWGARLPLKWKIRGTTSKYLLRKVAYRHIPKSIIDRPKQGFGVPMSSWLRNGLKSWATELLQSRSAMERLGLNYAGIQRLWAEHQSCRHDHHTILWTVLSLLQYA